jgi:hypothetical protein
MRLSALTSSIRKSPAPTSSLDMNAYVDTVFRGKNADDLNTSNFVVRTSGEATRGRCHEEMILRCVVD